MKTTKLFLKRQCECLTSHSLMIK